MQLRVVVVNRQVGIGKVSGKPFDFNTVGGIMPTKHGESYVEVIVDKDHPAVEIGATYTLEFECYPDREKKLQVRVVALRPVAAAVQRKVA
jgi:hypothetical protein